MKEVVSFTIYLAIGFVEMFLITQRTSCIAKNKRKLAAIIVLVENVLTFFIILQLAKDVSANILNFGAYCIGSCAGTVVDLENFKIKL